jgi:hypothetical protein
MAHFANGWGSKGRWPLINLDLVANLEPIGENGFRCLNVEGGEIGRIDRAEIPEMVGTVTDTTRSIVVGYWRTDGPEADPLFIARFPVLAWELDVYGDLKPLVYGGRPDDYCIETLFENETRWFFQGSDAGEFWTNWDEVLAEMKRLLYHARTVSPAACEAK